MTGKQQTQTNSENAIISLSKRLFNAVSQRMKPPSGVSPLAFLLSEDTLRGRHITGIEALSPEELQLIIRVAIELKINKFDETQTLFAKGQTLVMLFEKPSLRTRVTFEAGMTQLGGNAIYLEGRLGIREPVLDVAKNLDRWIDGIMARTFAHETVLELARHAAVPVINGLSDREHPCQAIADFVTIQEHKKTMEGLKIAFVGDGNNVAHSLMLLSAKVGSNFYLACPDKYAPDAGIVATAKEAALQSGATIEIVSDPHAAVKNADVVYTDTWVSMGQEDEEEKRAADFEGYQVDDKLLSDAAGDVIIMHCLPAHRGQEVTKEVLDGPRSVIYDQAENRLHAQKAILTLVL